MSDRGRPDPDALLALAAHEGRGRLKVFLGAAPGVGKTYEMLTEARRLREGGADVLIGLLETHGRPETEAAAAGLPLLPRRRIEYRGQELEEFDLDAALARRPAVLLLDELAHTNAPGSRHPKRWQDVEELRDAGIEVWTTMNVQHLEGQSDAVARVTGVRVAETVPDRILADASAVELVDIPPAELLERMRAGKIYRPEQAERALRGFFKEGALAALREMALRRTADRVDADVTGWMRRNAVAGPWPVGDRVLVLVPGSPGAEPVLHQARRIADALRAPLLALHVERPDDPADPAAGLRLAETLGAETTVIAANNVPNAVLDFAREKNATHIVIGRGRPPLWRRLLGRTLTGTLARRADEFTLHVVARPPGTPLRTAAIVATGVPDWLGYAAVPALVGLATCVCYALDGTVAEDSFGMIYLAAVVAVAAWLGPVHAAAAAALSFLAWNFLFLPPRFTFDIGSAQDLLGAAVFGSVALLLSGTTGRLGRSVRAAAAQLAALRRLAALARRLNAQAAGADLQRALVEEAARTAGAPACLLLPLDDALDATLRGQFTPLATSAPEPVLRAASPPDAAPDEASMAAARWALAQGREAGRGTATLPNAGWRFLPLRAARDGEERVIGLLGVQADAAASDPDADRALDALGDLAAVALERARLADDRAQVRARGETEALRTALLTSLGHDLRTPLTTIRGAAETLRTAPALPEGTRADLLRTIEEEATRLARWMTAILDVVRLESGEVRAARERVDVAAALHEAADRAERVHAGRSVARELPEALAVPRLDPVLLGRVLENLLDNALTYSGADGQVGVTARREGTSAVLAIEDDGPGIPASDLGRVFTPFYRAERADRAAAGSGLGLSICRGLVDAMGGRIAAESPLREGRGTRIVVRFPL